MNESKIQQINSRIEELNNLSRGRGRIIDGYIISEDYLEEYSDLKELRDIVYENYNRISGIPYVSHEDMMIREDLLDQYINLNSKVNLSIDNTNVEEVVDQPSMETNEAIEDSNFEYEKDVKQEQIDDVSTEIENPINPEYDGSVTKGAELSVVGEKNDNINPEPEIDNPIHPEYDGPVAKGAELAIVDQKDIEEDIEEESLADNNKITYIDGTNIPYPREKFKDETIEEYEEYLKDHYRPYGLVEDDVEYYPNTNIPKPRVPYPHEWKNMHDSDSYYNQLLHYLSDKAFEAQKEAMKPKEDEPEIKQEPKKDNNKHEVKGIRKATEFLKKHKKKIIVALGLTALAVACCPGVIPSIMYANSVLWHHVPALLQGALHGCNAFLSGFVGASEISSGLWAINGVTLNATAAAGNLFSALGVSALTLAGSTSILATIKIAKDSIKEKWNNLGKKKKKEKQKEEDKDKSKDKSKEKDKNKEKTNDKEKNSSEKTGILDKIKDTFNKGKDNKPTNQTDEEIIEDIDQNVEDQDKNPSLDEDEKQIDIDETPEIQKEDKNQKTDFVDDVNKKIDQYIEVMPQMNDPKGYMPGLHASVPLNQANVHESVRDLNRINDIIINGQNTGVSNTINFDGHRIDPKDKAELQHLLKKHDINYDSKNIEEVKPEIQNPVIEENELDKDNKSEQINIDAAYEPNKSQKVIEMFEKPVEIQREDVDFSKFENPEWIANAKSYREKLDNTQFDDSVVQTASKEEIIEQLKKERESLISSENSDEMTNERTIN